VTRRLALLLIGLCLACTGGKQERDADELYLSGRFADALPVYAGLAASHESARLWAKTGATALRAGQLDSAAAAFLALASTDPSRHAEASDGLAEVARQSLRARDIGALATAVAGLERVAPEWPVTAYAYALVQGGALEPASRARMLPLALAGAPDAGTFDSLLLQYGALTSTSQCAEAAYAYRAVIRRSADAGMRDSAGTGYATCALRLGIEALDSGQVIPADRWFARASRGDPTGWTGRRALVGLGDARLKQGDPIAAAIAWQRAITAGEPNDSLSRLARDRLATLSPADSAGETTRMDVQ
jgi:tetratricopeptide (TPR) repeat protein